MNSFFKVFFASLLALVVYGILSFVLFFALISVLASAEQEQTGENAVLVVDLENFYPEIGLDNPVARMIAGEKYEVPALYDLLRMIRHAKNDGSVKGILLKCEDNNNGLAASEEIRDALLDFRSSKKFVYAYSDVISQGSYYVASAADKVYCNPQGGVDWRGLAVQLAFVKGTLDKLDIEPQVFYAGKFKSATEPLRETEMSEANREQMTELVEDVYAHFLTRISASRNIDTATLRRCADENLLQFASGALQYRFVDGLRYPDQVNAELRQKLGIKETARINLVPMGKYAKAVNYRRRGDGKIAVIFAQGDIIDGKGEREQIGSDTYRHLIQRARNDKSIKAIVLRVNSGGGSAMASENIWREVTLAQQQKPLVVSFGDVAASGGYYLSCNADSIFAERNTITGSIGVFTFLPNMQGFFNDKLGVTFDGVKTSPYADALTVTKPLSEMEKRFIQAQVDTIYQTFKARVAEGRNLDIQYVDSIGQGRIWTGADAVQLGLVDRIGGLQKAVDCAARMAKLDSYSLREYPRPQNVLDVLLGNYSETTRRRMIRNELGDQGMRAFDAFRNVSRLFGKAQTRMPYDIFFR